MSTDAIVLLKNDHRQIRKLFRDFQDAGRTARTTVRRPGSPKKAVDAVLD